MSPARVRALETEVRLIDCRTRLPFRFGAATVTEAPLVTVRVRADVDGRDSEGFAADLAMPRWFDKDPAKSLRQNSAELVAGAITAGGALRTAGAGTPFELWRHVYRTHEATVGLVHGFAVSLWERALIDATCRAKEQPFFEALRSDALGFRPEAVRPELRDWDLTRSLPEEPLSRVRVRHTIGLVDPLTADSVAPDHAARDGLPESLGEDVERYGFRAFKVKIGGDRAANVERLNELAAFLPTIAGDEWFVTLDGNEQVASVEELEATLAATDPGLLERILFVEQPFARGADVVVHELSQDVVLDEGDGTLEDFPRALAAGYRGVSVKNCKGVFRALLNRGLCDREGAFQTAEDLTNLPVLSLQQDLATVAALGLTHVERNGHHYFHGLDHLPTGEAEDALAAHPELYEEQDGTVLLRIENGELDLSGLQVPGYGVASRMDFEAREPAESWLARGES